MSVRSAREIDSASHLTRRPGSSLREFYEEELRLAEAFHAGTSFVHMLKAHAHRERGFNRLEYQALVNYIGACVEANLVEGRDLTGFEVSLFNYAVERTGNIIQENPPWRSGSNLSMYRRALEEGEAGLPLPFTPLRRALHMQKCFKNPKAA